MLKLVVFNSILLIVIAALLYLARKKVKSEKARDLLFLVSALVTILFHYSTFIFRALTGNEPFLYMQENPNLILPMYPCNVVMWSCLVLGLMKNKKSKLYSLLVDYIFWFGIFSTLVGMFANVDFILNPTLKNYDVTKSIVAHATLLFNLLLLAVYGRVKLDFFRNMKNMLVSVIGMYVIGCYCNLVFRVLVSPEKAYDENSMFIIHSPFEGLEFLTYPVIAIIALLLYFLLFAACDIARNEKGNRFYDKICRRVAKKFNRKEK